MPRSQARTGRRSCPLSAEAAGRCAGLREIDERGDVAKQHGAAVEDETDARDRSKGCAKRPPVPKGNTSLRRIRVSFFSYDKFVYQDAAAEFLWPLIDAISNRRVCTVTYVAPRPHVQARDQRR